MSSEVDPSTDPGRLVQPVPAPAPIENDLGSDELNQVSQQLKDDNQIDNNPTPVKPPFRRLFRPLTIGIILLIIGLFWGGLLAFRSKPNTQNLNANPVDASQSLKVQSVPLNGLSRQLQAESSQKQSNLTVNGQLTVNNSLILTPMPQPSKAVAGEVYYDEATNQLVYFDGTKFIFLQNQTIPHFVTTSIGGATGTITLGSGLLQNGGQLSSNGVLSIQGQSGNVTLTGGDGISISGATITNSGVLSLGGQNGTITLGNGLAITNKTLSNTGVLSVSSGSPNITVTNDGNGNVTVSSTGSGSGTISSPGGTAGQIAMFTGSQTIAGSLLNQSGSTVTLSGSLNVTGSLILGTPLTIANGGTGANSAASARTNLGAAAQGANSDITSLSGLTTALSPSQGGTGATSLSANGVLVGNGTSPITSVVAGSAGQCLTSTSGAPVWQACPGSGGVGGSGTAGAIAMFTSSSAIGDSILSQSGTTVTVAGTLSATTLQGNGAAITSLNASNVNSGTLADARLSTNVTLQGNTFNGINELVQLNGTGGLPALNGSLLTNLNASNIASGTVADARLSTNVPLLNANNNFTGTSLQHNGNDVCDASNNCGYLTGSAANGSYVELQGVTPGTAQTGNFNITGTGIAGSLKATTVFQNGNQVCDTSGNCAGVGGGITGSGTANTIAMFTGSGTIGNSILTQASTTVTVAGTLSATNLTGSGSGITNLNASNIASGTVADARLSTNVTLQGNSFNGVNQLVQLNGTGGLPALDGSLLTNLNASNVSSGTLADARLSGNVTLQGNTFNGTNELVQLNGTGGLPALNGSLLTNLNASNIASGTLADARLSANVPLLNGNNNFTGTTLQHNGNDVCDASNNCGYLTGSAANGSYVQLQGSTPGTAQTGNFNVTGTGIAGSLKATTVFQNGNQVCDTSGNCVGTGGSGAIGGSGTTNTLAMFTGTGTIGDSILTQASTTVTVAGTLSATTLQGNGSGITSLNASNVSSGTLADARLSTNVTLQGNTFNGVNELVQLNGTGGLPALDGSLLTNLNATNISSGTLADARLSTNVTLQGNTFNGANELVQLNGTGGLPALDGSLLTNLNAGNIASGTLSDARLSTNVALYNNSVSNFTGALQEGGNDVCTTAGNCAGAGGGITGAGTNGTIAMFTGSGTIGNSILTQSGTTVTVGGTLSATNLQGNGSGVTNLNASNISSGTLADARLSANVPLLNGNNNFTGTTLQHNGNDVCDASGNCVTSSPKTATKIVAMGTATGCTGTATPIASSNPKGADYVSTSCTAADTTIQTAINAVSTAGGGIVYMEEGRYIISSSITIPSNVTLTGAGQATVLMLEDGLNTSIDMLAGSSSPTRVNVANLRLDGNKANNSSGTQNGINLTSGSSTLGVTIDNVDVENFRSDGIKMTGLGTDKITNLVASSNGGNGINIGFSNNNSVVNNNVTQSNGNAGITAGSSNVTISGNTASSNSGDGIDLTGGTNSSVNGNTISGNTGNGVNIGSSSVSYNTVSGNTISNNTASGVTIADLSGIGNTLTGNNLYNNGGTGSNDSIHLQGAGCANDSITDNSIIDTAGTGFAINITTACNYTYLSNNTYSGTGATSINDSSPTTVYGSQLTSNNDVMLQGEGAVDIGGSALGTASLTVTGGYNSVQLATPTQPSVTATGGSSTTWGYKITALDGSGETAPSTEGQTTLGAATLDGTHFNTIKFARVNGAIKYNVYRTTASGTPGGTGLVATITAANLTATNGTASIDTVSGLIQWNDTGFSATTAVPSSNTTGGIQVAGAIDSTTSGGTLTLGSTHTATGAVNIASGATTGTVTVGGTTQTGTITLGQSTGTNTINMGSAAGNGATQTINIGTSTTSGSTTNTNVGSTTTGSTTIVQGGSTSQTLTNSGAVIKSNNNSLTALQVQNSSGLNVLTVDTGNLRVGINVNNSFMQPITTLASSPAAGGSLPAGAYKYEVTTIDSAGGETAVSNEVTGTTAGGNLTNALTWTAVTGASGYNIYRTTAGGASGSETFLTSVLTNSYNDTGSITLGTGSPPSVGTAYRSTSVTSNSLQLDVGGLGSPTGQVYVSGSVPSTAEGTIITKSGPQAVYVQGRYAYVAAAGSNFLQIIDVSNPASPVAISALSLTSPRSIYVQGRYAYVTTSTNLQIIDVSNPTSPSVVGTLALGTSTTQSVYVQGQYAYVISSAPSLQVVDVSNPASPASVGSVATGATPQSIYVQGRYAYVVNHTGTKVLQIFDISNPASPASVGSISAGSAPYGVYVQGRYAYVTDSGANNLNVFDVSNPASPASVGSLGLGNTPQGLSVQGRYAYVANTVTGTMQVVDVSNPAKPAGVGTVTTGSSPFTVFVQGRYAYVPNNSSNTLQVFDVGGAYVQQLQTGGLETGTLQTNGDATINGDLALQGGISLGAGAQIGGQLGVAGNATIQGSLRLAGGISGGITVSGLSTPSAPTVSPQGTTGATSYSYAIVAVSASGNTTPASPVGSTSTGNATLSAGNFNQITWSGISGATSYKIYRTASGGSPSTTGLIGTTSSLIFNDTGLAGDSTTAPTVDTSGQLTVNGPGLFKNASNSTSAFQVQNASGASLFGIDTTTANLISNPSFETNTTGWASSGTGASLARNTTASNVYSGSGSLAVTLGSSGGPWGATVNTFTSTLSAGTYTLTFYAMGSASLGGLAVSGFSGGTCTLNSTSVSASGFQQYSCTITTTGTTSSFSITTTTTSQTLYLDALQLITGSTVTPYQLGAIQLNGVVNSPVTFQSTSNSNTAFQVQSASSVGLFTIDTSGSHVIIGSPSICTGFTSFGRFCTGQSVTSSGGTSVNANSISTVQTTGTQTVIGQKIILQDTSSSIANTDYGLQIDTYNSGATTNSLAQINGIQVTNPATNPGNLLDLQQGGGSDVFSVSNAGQVTIGVGATGESTPKLLVLDNGTSSSDPGTEVNGAMYYNSNMRSFRCGQNGAWVACDGLVKSITAVASGDTIDALTSTEQNFADTYTIPANDCQPGVTYMITASGVYDTAASSGGLTYTIYLDLNGTSNNLAQTGAMATRITNVSGGGGWTLNAQIVCDTASNTIEAQGFATIMNSTNGGPGLTGADANVGNMASNTTSSMTRSSSNTLGIGVSSGTVTGTPGNTMVMRQFIIQRLGP